MMEYLRPLKDVYKPGKFFSKDKCKIVYVLHKHFTERDGNRPK